MKSNEIVIYKSAAGEVKFELDKNRETVWATQAQIAELFGIDRTRVTRHINNILSDEEVAKSNVRKAHFANSDRPVSLYSLDMILSVGYRTNSKAAINFRRWANSVLRQYILNGVVVNEERLAQLRKVVEIVSRSEITEVSGVAEVIHNYAKSLEILAKYDENRLSEPKGKKPKFTLTYDLARKFLDSIKTNSSNFARERGASFRGIIAGLYQTFGGQDLYQTTEEKAANLLYQVVKDHPFLDGNKRSAAALFAYFLDQNGMLRAGQDLRVAPNALAAMTLMTALSRPDEKDNMILLIQNLLIMPDKMFKKTY